jgi:hypothetical protein
MFEMVERAGEVRTVRRRYDTLGEATAALASRAAELRGAPDTSVITDGPARFVVALHDHGITVACLRRGA